MHSISSSVQLPHVGRWLSHLVFLCRHASQAASARFRGYMAWPRDAARRRLAGVHTAVGEALLPGSVPRAGCPSDCMVLDATVLAL